MGTGFSEDDRSRIAGTFAMIARDLPGATAVFYRHLFRLAPGTRRMFVADLDRQGRRLAETLPLVVDQMDRWGLLRTALEDLAVRHTDYGVRAEHHAFVGEALVATFHERLGPGFGSASEAAWRRLTGQVGQTMIDAAYPARLSAEEPG